MVQWRLAAIGMVVFEASTICQPAENDLSRGASSLHGCNEKA
jgi:hypothetical protein